MVVAVAAVAVVAALAALAAAADNDSYTFYQWLRRGPGARRLYGAAAVRSAAWGAVCALHGPRGQPSCSCAVLAPRWALTAAHCVGAASFVHYNSQHAQLGGARAAVAARYVHPRYAVTVRSVHGVPEVRALQHDVGLLRAATDMRLAHVPRPAPLDALRMYPPDALIDSKLEVLGFGKWEGGQAGESLRAAELRAVRCGRAAWRACVCGAGGGGVCAGDSGGPALLGDALVALSSLGPVACSALPAGDERGTPASVLTALQPYADLLDATVAGDATRPRLAQLPGAAPPPAHRSAGPTRAPPLPLLATLLLRLLAARC